MLKNWDKRKLVPLIILIVFLGFWQINKFQRTSHYLGISGTTMGPITYNIKYADQENRNLQPAIDSILNDFNNALSTYVENSEISLFNITDSIIYQSPYLFPVFAESKKIYTATDGAFDPTVGPLVNAYGFGPGSERVIDALNFDSLLDLVGFDNVSFDNVMAKKSIKGSYLDFSAIAKGYAVDVIHSYLRSCNITDFMVEIGGEVSCFGRNPDGNIWRIGIEDPMVSDDEVRLKATVELKDLTMATSGNYRNFYEIDGKKYSHTINPKTGNPVEHSLLSVSVFAPTCMTADAFATSFMVMGLEKSLEKVNLIDSVEAFFIYANEQGAVETIATDGIKKMITQ
ncbi:MAG: FAD:protein FMN transferase [Bacteroidetes bacterium]|nr:FAD:protein FMN transferase [Bacteroidota bacterium]MDA1119014.1 FAD:protein FMN transferase [Bacteroidota bacterium]